MAVDPYVYPGTNVLRNRFGIRDASELARREAQASAYRTVQLGARPLPGRYDLPHLQAFHRHLFGDLYPWAGEIRTVVIAKGDLFALPEHIVPYLTDLFTQLAAEKHLRGVGRKELVARLTHYLAEINAVHPFREGNGRMQRAFLGQLATERGYWLAWERGDRERNIAASIAAMRGDNGPLHAMLDSLVDDLGQ
jgi:cell filamentation protein